ncbi:Intradiol ring-cleavage dioxygenase [Tricladium varicosporioides]|nr:Intradiol ring-cleavage dioxygenase [Hymenoscyphus varicosporioides]
MKFSQASTLLVAAAALCAAHPERLTTESAKRELIGRGTDNCAAQIEARKADMLAKRSASLRKRQVANGKLFSKREELQYTTIQNDTCVLAPDTIFGPYAIDEEIFRHDLREGQSGVDLYLDIGVIDVETCEPLPNAYLTIWHCNATGSYSGFTGINPQTSELLDGWTKQNDGTTDDETFLRGIMSTDTNGMAEFLTIFPGYYVTRSTHIHLTVQTNVTTSSSYSAASVQHIGQLFFNESIINSVYELDPYAQHLLTLNRTTNSEDKLYTSANADGYSSVISVTKLGADLADGLVGYITVGVNSSAAALTTSGESVNPMGVIPTVSVASSVRAAATIVDVAAGYGAA